MVHVPDDSAYKPFTAADKGKAKDVDHSETPLLHTAYISPSTHNLTQTLHPKKTTKVNFQVSNVKPKNCFSIMAKEKERRPRTSREFLEVHSSTRLNCKDIVYSSFGNDPSNSSTSDVIPDSHGFVSVVMRAWNNHLHLEIRPDDVWMAIITQFSRFINANSERFRTRFVAFSGKKHLNVIADATRETLNYGLFAVGMTKLLEEIVVDPRLREWIVPRFSTTTLNDTIASSMVMMSTLGKYFEYYSEAMCGIPSVTLHGVKRDWEILYKRIEKLKEFGLETIMWYHLLEPVLKRFIKAWDDPDGEWNKQFWGRVITSCGHLDMMCAEPTEFDGWLTAFLPFNDEGKLQLEPALPNIAKMTVPETVEAESYPSQEDIHESSYNISRYEFMRTYNPHAMAYPIADFNDHPQSIGTKYAPYSSSVHYSEFGIEVFGLKLPYTRWYENDTLSSDSYWEEWARELGIPDVDSVQVFAKSYSQYLFVKDGVSWSSMRLVIDGTWYPRGKIEELPTSVCEVDVHFKESGRAFESVMVGGAVGYQVRQSTRSDTQPGLDDAVPQTEGSLLPKVGWWIYEKRTTEEIEQWKAQNPGWNDECDSDY